MIKTIFGKSISVLSTAAIMLAAAPVYASGGNNSSASNVVTTSGPCPTEFVITNDSVVYPLQNTNFTGNVAMVIKMTSGVPVLESACLETGWTIQSKPATNGIQATLFYRGVKGIDFKYVLGKTDIRFY